VLSDGERTSRIVWTVDVLPDGLAPGVESMMDEAVSVMAKTLVPLSTDNTQALEKGRRDPV
jgi:hypothetical protein